MKRMLFVALFAAALFSAEAIAQESRSPGSSLVDRAGYANIGLYGGYMFDPDMPMGMINLDYFVTDEFSVGPYFQSGGAGHNSYWGLAGQVRYTPALAGNSNVRPYLTGGIGFCELDFEDRDDGEDDLTYFFPVGGGMEFGLTDILSLDLGGLFNITEDSFAGMNVGLRILL